MVSQVIENKRLTKPVSSATNTSASCTYVDTNTNPLESTTYKTCLPHDDGMGHASWHPPRASTFNVRSSSPAFLRHLQRQPKSGVVFLTDFTGRPAVRILAPTYFVRRPGSSHGNGNRLLL